MRVWDSDGEPFRFLDVCGVDTCGFNLRGPYNGVGFWVFVKVVQRPSGRLLGADKGLCVVRRVSQGVRQNVSVYLI